MICDYNHSVFSPGKVVAPFFPGQDDSEEFPIIDVIVLLCRREGGGVIGIGLKVPVGVLLHEYPPRHGEGGISHDKERFGGVWHLEYWGREECSLEFDECFVLLLSPYEGSPLFGQVVKWPGECGEVRDELSVEVAESNEGSDCFTNVGGSHAVTALSLVGSMSTSLSLTTNPKYSTSI